MTKPPPPLAFSRHDHQGCRTAAMDAAEAACAAQGLRLTDARRRALEILTESHQALGAYEVLRRMTPENARPQPPVAYRALEFLVAAGLAHRLERRNAYVACAHPGAAHDPAFMICRDCCKVAETAAGGGLSRAAEAAGFAIERTVVEAEGLCPDCQNGDDA